MDSKFLKTIKGPKTLKGAIEKASSILHSRKRTHNGPLSHYIASSIDAIGNSENHTFLQSAPSVNALPDAILRRIFVLHQPYVQPEPEEEALSLYFNTPYLSFSYYQHRLEHVCRRWRAIIYDTPILWTTITLHGHRDYSTEELREILELSKGLTLDIFVRPWSYIFRGTGRVIDSLKVLKHERSRIRCLFWKFAHKEELVELFPMEGDIVTEYPRLEVFCLVRYRSYSTDGLPMGRLYTPKLRHLQLGEAALIQCFMTTMYLPLETLSLSENIFALTYSFYLQFLALCPRLVSLSISISISFDIDGTWPFMRLTLPALQRLWLFAAFTNNVLLLIRSLDLPVLKKLKFGDYNIGEENYKTPLFWHLLSESASTLEQLSLDKRCMPIGVYVSEPLIFRLVNIQVLTLSEFQIHMTILEPLIPDPDTPPERWVLPRLKAIKFRRTDIDGDLIPKLIQTRSFSDNKDEELQIKSSLWATMAEEKSPTLRRRLREAPHLPDWILHTVEVRSCCFLDDETYAKMLQLSLTHGRVVGSGMFGRHSSSWTSLDSL